MLVHYIFCEAATLFSAQAGFFSLYDVSWLWILSDGNSRLEGEKRKGWERRSLQNSLRAPLLPASPFLFLFCLCALCLHLCFFVLTASECMLPSTCSSSSPLAAVSVNLGRFVSPLMYPIHAAVNYMFTATARKLFSSVNIFMLSTQPKGVFSVQKLLFGNRQVCFVVYSIYKHTGRVVHVYTKIKFVWMWLKPVNLFKNSLLRECICLFQVSGLFGFSSISDIEKPLI